MFITGEQIQEQCDVFLGYPEDFRYNPRILRQTKCLDIRFLPRSWANPRRIFVYGHRLLEFMSKVDVLQNEYVLVSHNSDENITDKYISILQGSRLIRWYAQNPMINHEKLHLLPIGIANSMWKHGNLKVLQKIIDKKNLKTEAYYFYFSVNTNISERQECKQALESKLTFERPKNNFEEYLEHLSKHKYAICPPGNGIDSHRIWECLYLGVIPIVKRSVFTELLSKEYTCIILDSWNDFDSRIINTYIPPDIPKPILF
jgi:hypothetical protein